MEVQAAAEFVRGVIRDGSTCGNIAGVKVHCNGLRRKMFVKFQLQWLPNVREADIVSWECRVFSLAVNIVLASNAGSKPAQEEQRPGRKCSVWRSQP